MYPNNPIMSSLALTLKDSMKPCLTSPSVLQICPSPLEAQGRLYRDIETVLSLPQEATDKFSFALLTGCFSDFGGKPVFHSGFRTPSALRFLNSLYHVVRFLMCSLFTLFLWALTSKGAIHRDT